LITTFVFEKNANFFAENCQKSQKTVIITSTLGRHLVGRQRSPELLTVHGVLARRRQAKLGGAENTPRDAESWDRFYDFEKYFRQKNRRKKRRK
jgi:hypothetical protein